MILYVAGWNMPGCLPEMRPGAFDNGQDARRWLISEMESAGWQEEEAGGDPDPFYSVIARWEENDAEGVEDWSRDMPDGYVYWIEVRDVTPVEARAMMADH